ncbi:hypothetical protein ACFSHR_04970 [Azotobacter chroococcum]
MQLVAVLEVDAVQLRAAAVEGVEVEAVLLAVTLEDQSGNVGSPPTPA